MTILNVTVGLDGTFALISCDTALGKAGGEVLPPSQDVAGAWRKAMKGSGEAPTFQVEYAISKFFVYPHINAVLAATGDLEPIAEALAMVNPSPAHLTDAREIAPYVKARLPAIAERHSGKGLTLVLVGIVPGGIVRGYAWSSAEGFVEHDLDGRSVIQPAIPLADAEYEAAALGRSPFAFHKRVCAEQMQALRAGKFPSAWSAGGRFTFARLDASGISIRTLDEAEIAGALPEAWA